MISLSKQELALQKQIDKTYQETYEYEDFIQSPPNDLVAFNELRTCAEICDLFSQQTLEANSLFQRKLNWKEAEKTRFIDSLMKQIPIPNLCWSWDSKTGQRFIVDGFQRITTIVQFLSQADWQLSDLPDVDFRIRGKSVQEIQSQTPRLYQQVENLSLPITAIYFDSTQESHLDYLYTIFHRLNTGGTKLNNQEIRNCLYQGNLNQLLKDCSKLKTWQQISPVRVRQKQHLKDEEFILRFFAFFDDYEQYSGTLTQFLNRYMYKNKNLESSILEQKINIFKETITLIDSNYLPEKLFSYGQNISALILEGILIGIAKNLSFLKSQTQEEFKVRLLKLIDSEPYSPQQLANGLLQTSQLKNRLTIAIHIFGT